MSKSSESQQIYLAIKLNLVRNSLNALSEQIKTLAITGKQKLYEKVLKNNGLIDPEEYNIYIVYEEKLDTLLSLVKKYDHCVSFSAIKSKSSLSSDQFEGVITGLLYTGELVQFKHRGLIMLATLENYKKYYKEQTPILPWYFLPF